MTTNRPTIDDPRFTAAVSAACDAFFIELARHYPEITSGDMSHADDMAFTIAADAAALAWVEGNAPA